MKNRIKLVSGKLISIVTILTLLIYIVNFVSIKSVYAAQTREDYDSNKISKYPGYKEAIERIKAAHPNWKIKIHYTNLDWNTVLYNETVETHTRSLVPKGSASSWICPQCGSKGQDSGAWVCASEGIVAHMMDPRNWINDNYIFQFENLAFNGQTQTLSGVQAITSKIGHLSGNTVTYTTTNGTKATINKSYAQIIYEAAQEAGISPYHLASRIRQEQGAGATASGTASGTYTQEYIGYYNFLNIGATGGNGDADLTVRNGLKKAKENGWTNPEISIKAGAKELASGYINIGQDTLYLQKFDVDDRGSMYYHQYMQNIFAPKNECVTMKDTYAGLGFLNNAIEFIIPVYENMPSVPCMEPGEKHIVTQNVQIQAGRTDVQVRASAGTSFQSIKSLNGGDKLLRIEIGTQSVNGYYWDKVVLEDGRKGYVAHSYLTQLEDITNCNEAVLTTTEVYLRNGPGIADTTTVELLPENQYMRRIEKGKYNIDGSVWDRVILPYGTQGYIEQKYLKNAEPNDKYKLENGKLICEPETTVESIKKVNHLEEVTIKNAKGEIVNSGNIGTDYTVTISDNNYTVVKLGDVNGDGRITPADSTVILRSYVGLNTLSDTKIMAADVNHDGKVIPADSTVVLRNYVGLEEIKL